MFTQGKHWSQFFLKKGFGHVYAIVPKQGLWVTIRPGMSNTGVDLCPVTTPLKNIVEDDAKVVYYEADVQPRNMRRLFSPINCVEIVKSFMGLSERLVLTPYQLYKRIT